MIKYLATFLVVAFLLSLIGCGGDTKPQGVNINPEKKAQTAPPAEKKVDPQVQWLQDTFGPYASIEELKTNYETMSLEDFEAYLNGLGNDEGKPSEEDIAKLMDFVKAQKAKEAEKAAAVTDETADGQTE